MQLVPRYLVTQRNIIIANEGTQITEYRQVYQKPLNVYKGIDNILEFQLLNTDQKPVVVGSRQIHFVAFDENNNLVIEHIGTVINSNKGIFTVTVTENDLLNLKQQYLSYNIYLTDAENNKLLTYTNAHYEAQGVIYVDGNAFPGPKNTYAVSQFYQASSEEEIFVSEEVTAEPAINGNEALHTAAIYTSGYQGTVSVEATLENQISGNSQAVNWAEVTTVELDGTELEPVAVNFNGVFSFLRFKTSANPADTITQILVRN